MLRVQLALVAAAPGLLLVPPESGAMLVLPLASTSPAETFNWTQAAGGRLLGAGPYAGSIVVTGDRARLARAAFAHGALVTAAPSRGCQPVSE